MRVMISRLTHTPRAYFPLLLCSILLPCYAADTHKEKDGDTFSTAELTLKDESDSPYHIGLRYFNIWGVDASMTVKSDFIDQVGPAQGGGIDRSYMDGFVFRDSSDNLGDILLPSRTHFFGFDDASQFIQDGNGGALQFHSLRRLENAQNRSSSRSVSNGVEFNVGRMIRRGNNWVLNLDGSLSFNRANSSSGFSSTQFELLTDTYPLGFVDPTVLGVPYAGRYHPQWGGSPKIGDQPVRSLSTLNGSVHGGSTVETDSMLLRLGPSWLYHPKPRFSVGFGAGLTLAQLQSEMTYQELEEVQWNGKTYQQRYEGSMKSSDALLGVYAGFQTNLKLRERWLLTAEVDAAHLGQMIWGDHSRTMRLDLGSVIMTAIGLRYKF